MGNVSLLPLAAALIAALPSAVSPEARSVDYKLDRIRLHEVRPGSAVVFSQRELNAWVSSQVPRYAPHGVRNTHLDLGSGTVSATALIDFLKVRQAQGVETNWLLARLITGEHPVRVSARLQSARGRATVYLQQVEISGMTISGDTL